MNERYLNSKGDSRVICFVLMIVLVFSFCPIGKVDAESKNENIDGVSFSYDDDLGTVLVGESKNVDINVENNSGGDVNITIGGVNTGDLEQDLSTSVAVNYIGNMDKDYLDVEISDQSGGEPTKGTLPLNVTVPIPKITMSPASIDLGEVLVNEEKTIDFDVTSTGISGDISFSLNGQELMKEIKWEHDPKTLPAIGGSVKVTLSSVTPRSLGLRFTASNIDHGRVSSDVEIRGEVGEPVAPSINTTETSMTVQNGATKTIDLKASGYPKPTLSAVDMPSWVTISKGSLEIKPTTSVSGGDYKFEVKADSRAGTTSKAFTVTIIPPIENESKLTVSPTTIDLGEI